MEILKKLLFLACMASIWPMLGMDKKENQPVAKKIKGLSAEQIKYTPFIRDTLKPNYEREEVQVQSLTSNEFIKTLNYGSQKGTKLRVNYSKSMADPDYEKYLFDMKFVDFVTVHPKQRGKPKRHEDIKINDFYIFFNFNKVEEPFLNKIQEFCEQLSILTEENKKQKLEIEKLTQKNQEVEDTLTGKIKAEFCEQLSTLTEENKKQKLEIEKLTQKNQEAEDTLTGQTEISFEGTLIKENEQQKKQLTEFTQKIEELTEKNKQQKLEIEKFKQNKEQLDQKEKLGRIEAVGIGLLFGTLYTTLQQNTQIKKLTQINEELTKQNEKQAEKLKNSRTAASARKSTTSAKPEEQPRSWLQRNNRLLSGLSVAAVMGGCMLLGASLYACFAK